MIGYAVLIWLARNLRLRDDQAGDNLYYMGFLFTLTSLGVSLYQFNAARAAEEIVQNFGIAIGSTITGIALRVIFNQMRQDPIEVERTMRLELADAARRVRRELDATVVEFGYIRRISQQAAATPSTMWRLRSTRSPRGCWRASPMSRRGPHARWKTHPGARPTPSRTHPT